MVEIVYRKFGEREAVIANRTLIGDIERTPRSWFRWSAWTPSGRLVTSRARSRTDATDALLEVVGGARMTADDEVYVGPDTAKVQNIDEPFWITHTVDGEHTTVRSEWERDEDGRLFLRFISERNDR